MAKKLYVTEYQLLGRIENGPGQMPAEPPVAEQVVDFSAGAASSAAFGTATAFVRIEADDICSVVFGTAPTATTSSQRVAVGVPQFHAVPQGKSFKVSAISNT